jgi:FkbM family methyltransferase
MKFNTTNYKSFSRINDETFPAVLKEAEAKLEYICSLTKNKQVCFQAGCNFGVFAHYLSLNFKQVITCEPSKYIYHHAHQNLKHSPNIKLINCGVGERELNCKESFDKKNCGATKLITNISGKIQVKTIDSILTNCESCDLIYLDIEGMEYSAIIGAKNTILKHKPVLVIENKGLIPNFSDGGINGSSRLRKEICSTFGYLYHKRLMRDDIFIPI